MPTRPRIRLTAWTAAAFYVAAALAWTWPLLPNITRSVAWDLGDPMLLAWIMAWVNDSLLALVRGDLSRFLALWDAPIFYPQFLTLAYSDHAIPQALFAFPVHAATGNVYLSYNVAFLATFVLSGLGMFLLGRELTGSAAAGLLAGTVFAFNPYRVDQLSHLAILSAQWMPLALYGLRRYFVTSALRPLVWGTLALVIHNLSSGYFLFFFAPFVAGYVLFEMIGRRLIRDPRTWRHLIAAGAACAILTVPFLIPYLAVREGSVGARSLDEVQHFSADVAAYATASHNSRWRELLDSVKHAPENATFPGAAAVLLTAGALVWLAFAAMGRWRSSGVQDRRREIAAVSLVALTAISAGMIVWILLTGGRIVEVLGLEIRLRNIARFAIYGAVTFAIAVILSRRLRAALRGNRGSLAAFALAAAIFAFLMSLGPTIEWNGRYVGKGPYLLFYEFVPGYDGLRVPSRFAMLVVMWLAIAGVYPAAAVARRWKRAGVVALAAVALLAIVESRPRRFLVGEPFAEPGVAPGTMTHRLESAEPLYAALGALPRGVLLELPFGTTGWDLQFMHAQRRHGWPLVNGFSGHTPDSHSRNAAVMNALTAPDRAWWALERSGATHVIVHEWAFASIERGKKVSQWLRDNGAVEVAATGLDTLFRLPTTLKHR